MDFPAHPMPNDPLLGGIVVASVDYNVDDYDYLLVTVVLLMPEAPYCRVGIVELHPLGQDNPVLYRWHTTDPDAYPGYIDHYNIVPAINGNDYPNPVASRVGWMEGPRADGYVDMGGDY